MNGEEENFKAWLVDTHPHVNLLRYGAVSIGGDRRAMETARAEINDFRLIRNPDGAVFTLVDAVALHMNFVSALMKWFEQDLAVDPTGRPVEVGTFSTVNEEGKSGIIASLQYWMHGQDCRYLGALRRGYLASRQSNSAQTTVWSEVEATLRGAISTSAVWQRAAITSVAIIWSMRQPKFRSKALRKKSQ
jgi:hypothetical protein